MTTSRTLSDMSVGIISDAHHYIDPAGRLYGLFPLARQFEQWAALFREVVICAPLLPGAPKITHVPYAAQNIRLLPIKPAGGDTIRAKVNLLKRIPEWWRAIAELFREVDAVHLRCPNNIGILGLIALRNTRFPSYAIYTGNWEGYPGEPITYRGQRVALRRWFRGPVGAYLSTPVEHSRIKPTFSPSYSETEWREQTEPVASKIVKLRERSPARRLQLLSVGHLSANKNQRYVLRLLQSLLKAGVPAQVTIAGHGPLRAELEGFASSLNISEHVTFSGLLGPAELHNAYLAADFVIQPSFTEGFSKVPVEAMLHGTIPLLSDIPVNARIVADSRCGATFTLDTEQSAFDRLLPIWRDPTEMIACIERGREYARSKTLEAWGAELAELLKTEWRE
ncbi:MAG TPA: glycosyltransferase [Gemmatimonadaceae bacterium]|nr:glycosyltransferase [Gemmatimonadaceae bacterium]